MGQALHLAGATGRLRAFDFSFNLSDTYTFWSGIIGGLFLMLAYFGCDQSQVQRYLTAKSVDEGRNSLLMSAYVKIPLQVLILLTGVLVFVFYLFNPPPLLFNPRHDAAVRSSAAAAEYAGARARVRGGLLGADATRRSRCHRREQAGEPPGSAARGRRSSSSDAARERRFEPGPRR